MLVSLTQIEITLLILITLLNVFSFGFFYSDKIRARKRRRRIPERTLLLSTFFFGGIGAYLGMKIFRHKTKHRLFTICVPLAAILTFTVIIFMFING